MQCTHSIMALSYSSTRRGYTAMYPSQRQNLINRSIDLYRDKYKEIVNVRKRVMSPPASLFLWSHLLFLNQRRRPQQHCLHHHYQYVMSCILLLRWNWSLDIMIARSKTPGRPLGKMDDTSPYPVIRTSWTLDNSRACGFLQLTHNCAWSDAIQHFFCRNPLLFQN